MQPVEIKGKDGAMPNSGPGWKPFLCPVFTRVLFLLHKFVHLGQSTG